MKLLIFRHAEREKLGTTNPPLTRKGRAQADSLASLIATHQIAMPTRLISSPLLRAQMTFTPAAEKLQLPLKIEQELNERQAAENASTFNLRVKSYLDKLARLQGTVFICTHLDWLEQALLQLHCDTDLSQDRYQSHWQPGAYLELQLESISRQAFWQLSKMGVLDDH